MWLCWRIMNGSFGVEKSPHLLMAFTISKLKWLYHINSGTTKVYSSPLRAVEETKQLLLFVYATQQHMSAGPSMALGGLGSAWSLKVAAVWTNLPVSHVTPSVSLGMWEDSAHPSSCHTVFRGFFFFFFAKGFCVIAAEKGWPPTLSIQSGWPYFFLLNLKFHCSRPPRPHRLVQKGQLCLIVSVQPLTCLFSKLFFSGSLHTTKKENEKSLKSFLLARDKTAQAALTQRCCLLFDNESSLIGST